MYSELNGISGVYQILSKIKPERIYIGHSVNIGKRWRDHIRELLKNKHGCHKLQNHYNKYGLDDLIFSLILLCNDSDLVTDEQYFIDTLKPYFNECLTAGSCLGIKRSQETCKKISESNKGRHNHWLGRHHTEETKKKVSMSQKGREKSEEERKNLSLGHMGIYPSEETKRKMGDKSRGNQYAKGHKHTEEWKKIRSEAFKKWWRDKKEKNE